MASVVEHRKFVFCRAGSEAYIPNGSNKVWEALLYDNDDVEVRFGKIGANLASKIHSGVGRSFMEKKIREKTTKKEHYDGECYREIKTLETGGMSSSSTIKVSQSTTELKALAQKQIAASCPITSKLIAYFTDVNAHDIYKATGGKIVYDTSSGFFKTPVGVVVQENVDEARNLLHNTLAPYVQKSDIGNIKFVRALEQYLMLVPKDIGRTFDARSILGTQQLVQEQEQILDALEASIKSIVSGAATKKDDNVTANEPPKLFSVKMNVLEDKKEWDRLRKKYHDTKSSMHSAVARFDVKTIYSVEIETEKAAFQKEGVKVGNVHEFYHGTKASNGLAILRKGLIIPPASSPYCTGRLYGDGVYAAPCASKSLQYATSFWGGKDENRYFMFMLDMAMGKEYVPKSRGYGQVSDRFPVSGYDSTWAKANVSGVQNDECIVYKTSQVTLKYLMEFTPGGK